MKNKTKELIDPITEVSMLFDENGITYKKERNQHSAGKGEIFHAFIPYRCILKIEIKCKVILEITFHENDKIRKLDFGVDIKGKSKLKSALRFIKSQRSKSTYKGDTEIYDENPDGYKDESNHIMHCQDCGHIYQYTDDDLRKNSQKIKDSGTSIIGAVAAGMAGNYIVSTLNSQEAKNSLNSIVDYYSCPKCHSKNSKRITEKELEELREKEKAPTAQPISNADELKKFKDLLDSGVITQEEFDQKKKQLLGL